MATSAPRPPVASRTRSATLSVRALRVRRAPWPRAVSKPAVEGVDGGDAGAVELGEAGGEQADDALSEDGDLFAEVDVGGQHRVVRDGTDPGESARQRLQAHRQGVSGHPFGGHDALAAVAPDAPDQVAHDGHARDPGQFG